MAKTISKSKSVKTKTTKKAAPAKAVKSTAKTTKNTVKETTAKVIKETTKEVKVAAKPKAAAPLTFAKLRGLHLLSAGIFALLAVLAGLFMDATSYQVSLGHITRDALNGSMVPAGHVLFNLPLRWVVVAMLLLSALISVVRYRNAASERAALDRRIMPLRWIDFAVTGAVMAMTAAVLSGMQDLAGLKLLGALAVFSGVFAWIAERENANAPRAVRGAYEASIASSAFVLLALASFAVATPVYGMVRAPWYVYALYGVLVIASVLVGMVQYREYRHKNGRAANYLNVERNYLVINLLTKTAFAAILIAGLTAK